MNSNMTATRETEIKNLGIICPDPAKPVRVALGGDVVWATHDTWSAEADKLHAKHGGVPEVKNFAQDAHLVGGLGLPPGEKVLDTVGEPESKPEVVRGQTVSAEGKERSQADFDGAVASGFAPKASLFERGTMVVSTGVSNARRSRLEHDKLPKVGKACTDFVQRIADEKRKDEVVTVADLRMNTEGLLCLRSADGKKTVNRWEVTPNAFGSFMTAVGVGGGAYLSQCWPALRAVNVNNWMDKKEKDEQAQIAALKAEHGEDAEIKLDEVRFRTRVANSKRAPREVFAAVSSGRYTPFDVDVVAKGLAQAMPDDARARIKYDGEKAIFDVQFHSNVQPEKYVSGEFFKAGVRVRTDDTGGGSLVGEAFVYQNLCLNLIILDRATQPLFRIRHTGDVDAIAARFTQGMKDAKTKLAYFMKAWGYAVDDTRVIPFEEGIELPAIAGSPLVTKAHKFDKLTESEKEASRKFIAGIYNSIIQRELVPVVGRKAEAIPLLVQAWEKDTSYAGQGRITRGSVVNAFTRYAHETVQDDFVSAQIERAVPELLYGRGDNKPAPLSYLPVGS